MKRLEWKATSPISILWTDSMMKMIIITFESTWLNCDLGTMCTLIRERNCFLCDTKKQLIVSHLVTVWHLYLKWHRIIFTSSKFVMLFSDTQFECCQWLKGKDEAYNPNKKETISTKNCVTFDLQRLNSENFIGVSQI